MKVPLLTPVEFDKSPWIKYPAFYLQLRSGDRAIVNKSPIRSNGSHEARKNLNHVSGLSTTVKIISYILSVGIFPLLALLVLLIARGCGPRFHWATDAISSTSIPAPSKKAPSAVADWQQRFHKNPAKSKEFDIFLAERQEFLAKLRTTENQIRSAIEQLSNQERSDLKLSNTKTMANKIAKYVVAYTLTHNDLCSKGWALLSTIEKIPEKISNFLSEPSPLLQSMLACKAQLDAQFFKEQDELLVLATNQAHEKENARHKLEKESFEATQKAIHEKIKKSTSEFDSFVNPTLNSLLKTTPEGPWHCLFQTVTAALEPNYITFSLYSNLNGKFLVIQSSVFEGFPTLHIDCRHEKIIWQDPPSPRACADKHNWEIDGIQPIFRRQR